MHEYNKVAICLFRTLLLAQFLFEQVSTDGCTGWVKAKRTGGPGNTVLVIIYGNALAGGSLHGTGRNTTRYATQSLSHRYHCCRARLVASINIGLSVNHPKNFVIIRLHKPKSYHLLITDHEQAELHLVHVTSRRPRQEDCPRYLQEGQPQG
ncbi:uncharacterized protein LOC124369793 [Homalodisca vitripennis]|uniref:uncharacterized protein LOC124369793 n=1 Tax=Homalodisca vitripennis TaxID=197043 RepID=UPI001EECEFB2|nr:uncharacterized protein LOC124369793 [Homalodisca vitripennis]